MPMPHRRPAPLFLAAACAALLTAIGATATAADAPAKATAAPAQKTVPKPAAKPVPATSRQQVRSEAKGLALATEVTEAINDAQLDIAARVLTGTADCEFNQRIEVQPVEGKAGYFTVSHQGKRYRMVPRETATGAVRLEDPVNGIVWLQIPVKSMLMNAQRGQRMVDACTHSEQRAALAAATAAGQSANSGIGIVPQAAPVPDAAASR